MALQTVNLITDNKLFQKVRDAQNNLIEYRFAYILVDDVMGTKWFQYHIAGNEFNNLPPSGTARRQAIRQILMREIAYAYQFWVKNYIPQPVDSDISQEL